MSFKTFCLVLGAICAIEARGARHENEMAGFSRALGFYNPNERPNFPDEKVTVNVRVHFNGIQKIRNQYGLPTELEVDMILQTYWDDARLADAVPEGQTSRTIRISAERGDDLLWMPKLKFPNVVEGGVVKNPDIEGRTVIFSAGRVQRDVRVLGRFPCSGIAMGGSEGACPIIIAQMIHPESELDLQWTDSTEPYSSIDALSIQGFTISSIDAGKSTFTLFEAGPEGYSSPEFSQLALAIHIAE